MISTYSCALVNGNEPVAPSRPTDDGPDRPIRVDPATATVRFRTTDDSVETLDWDDAAAVLAAPLAPWRTFRWWYGQQHYSGTYWSRTQRDHVIYESRLELARLIYADFDRNVTSIAAQPFLLEAEVDGRWRRHVPDFLLRTPHGPVVVEVKPRDRVSAPTVAYTLSWARQLIEDHGWEYEVWSEPPPVELANLRFLAGYRDERRINKEVLELVRQADLDCLTVGQATVVLRDLPRPLVRAAICHLLWHGTWVTDFDAPLQATSVLRKGTRS
ncbi:TnsA-like heteromeric transposase endonuclease subunit [Mycolicibacter sp. MYC098]|uniref:TnsA-like heteromeric transposase endonuclease subunit n=1 Tax=[Mycobacterium] crassicus TaxID=2872309 RepID=A0ABU5XCL2_9MYCO|nr:TnsA-like heteromeric transposase endonuclease subunit [Mycolicibacter sp. MYC098]MEB3020035.1 TnsA-like heteromeric transposase endonuclease subunit [Mycolicibacter sp. MYC098]